MHNNAIIYDNSNFGKTYLLVDNDKLEKEGVFEIIAFFTIGKTSVDISSLSQKQKRKLLGNVPGRDKLATFPGYLIGQIGRCDAYTKEHLSGVTLLNECYSEIKKSIRVVGGKLIILECRPHMYEKFYQKVGFKPFLGIDTKENLKTLYTTITLD